MSYLKEDEKIHRKFEEDDAILQAQSNGQEALIDNFQCYKTGYNKGKAEAKSRINDTAKQIFAELDNLHIVENWSTQNGKGIPLLLKQIGAYKAVKKKFSVLK
jgi:outer membrane protein assembly factor BamD (BamD/ComL family)